MTSTDDDTPRRGRQRLRLDVHLGPGAQPQAMPVSTYPHRPPIAAVGIIDGLNIQSDDVDVLRAMADAFEDAARALAEAQLDHESRVPA